MKHLLSKYTYKDSLPTLIFDMNGTLTNLTNDRHKYGVYVRPNVSELNKLTPYFNLVLWTSATSYSATEMIKQLNDKINNKIFCDILTRKQCIKAPYKEKKHATIKYISDYYYDLSKVLIIEDDGKKIIEKFHKNWIAIPPWSNHIGSNDDYLSILVDSLLYHYNPKVITNHSSYDIRSISKLVQYDLFKDKKYQIPSYRTDIINKLSIQSIYKNKKRKRKFSSKKERYQSISNFTSQKVKHQYNNKNKKYIKKY